MVAVNWVWAWLVSACYRCRLGLRDAPNLNVVASGTQLFWKAALEVVILQRCVSKNSLMSPWAGVLPASDYPEASKSTRKSFLDEVKRRVQRLQYPYVRQILTEPTFLPPPTFVNRGAQGGGGTSASRSPPGGPTDGPHTPSDPTQPAAKPMASCDSDFWGDRASSASSAATSEGWMTDPLEVWTFDPYSTLGSCTSHSSCRQNYLNLC